MSPSPDLTQAEDAAKQSCLRLLTVRPRSRAELLHRLRADGVDEQMARRVLDRMEQVQLVDDASFAQAWVRSRQQFSGRGRRALVVELQRKGVAEELIQGALGEVDDEAEHARARELLRRKSRSTAAQGPAELLRRKSRSTAAQGPAAPAAAARRLTGLLARRGFAPDVVRSAVRAELATLGIDAEDLSYRR